MDLLRGAKRRARGLRAKRRREMLDIALTVASLQSSAQPSFTPRLISPVGRLSLPLPRLPPVRRKANSRSRPSCGEGYIICIHNHILHLDLVPLAQSANQRISERRFEVEPLRRGCVRKKYLKKPFPLSPLIPVNGSCPQAACKDLDQH